MPEIEVTDPRTKRRVRIRYTGTPPSDADIAHAFESAFAPEPRIDSGRVLSDAMNFASPEIGLSNVGLAVMEAERRKDESTAADRATARRLVNAPAPGASGPAPLFSSASADPEGRSAFAMPGDFRLEFPQANPWGPRINPVDPTAAAIGQGIRHLVTGPVEGPLTVLDALYQDRVLGDPGRAARTLRPTMIDPGSAGGRAAAAGILPGAGGLGAGAIVGEGVMGLTGNPLLALGAGVVSAIAGGGVVSNLQNRAVDLMYSPEAAKALRELYTRDREEQPLAVVGGEIASNLPFMRFSPSEMVKDAKFVSGLFRRGGAAAMRGAMGEKAFGESLSGVIGNAIGTALPVGQEVYGQMEGEGRDLANLDWGRIALTGAGGLLFNRAYGAGERIQGAGKAVGKMFDRTPLRGLDVPDVDNDGVRYAPDGRPVRVLERLEDGRLRVQVDGEDVVRRVTQEQYASMTRPVPGGEPGAESRVNIRSVSDLADAFHYQFGLSREEAQRVATAYDSVFREEARRSGKSVEDVYGERLAAIQRGGEAIAQEIMRSRGVDEAEITRKIVDGDLPRGVAEWDKFGRAVVTALVNPDTTTGYHELGHVVRKMLSPAEQARLAAHYGATQEADGTWKWGEEAEEHFADDVMSVEGALQRRAQEREQADAGINPLLRKVRNVFRFIGDRLQQVFPRLKPIYGVDGKTIVNPETVRLLNERFGRRGLNSGGERPAASVPGSATAETPGVPGEGIARAVAGGSDSAGSGRVPGGVGEQPAPTPNADLSGDRAVGGAGGDRGSGVAAEGASGDVPGRVDEPGAVEYVDPDSIEVLPGMQFKRDLVDSSANVTDQLKGQKEYDAYEGGILTVYEDRSGRRFVVDGHHRLELAKRAKGYVRPVPGGSVPADRQIAVRVLREADGWTPESAKAWGVRRNLREGKARAIDAADALVTLGNVDEARAEVANLPKSAVIRDTAGLIELDQAGREQVLNRKVSESVAAGIGKALPGDPARQKIALDLAANRSELKTYEDGVALGREVAQEDVVSGPQARQLGFEGFDTPDVKSTAAERALIRQDVLARAVREQKGARQGLDLDLLPGESIDQAARERIATMVGDTKGAVGLKVGAALEFDPAVKEAVKTAARDLAEGKISRQAAAGQVYDAVVASASRPIAEITSGKPYREAVQESPAPSSYAMDQGEDTATSSLFGDEPPPVVRPEPVTKPAETPSPQPIAQPVTNSRAQEIHDRVGEIEASLEAARQRLKEARAAAKSGSPGMAQRVQDYERSVKSLAMQLSAARKQAAAAPLPPTQQEASPYAMDRDPETESLFQRARRKSDEVIEQLERTPSVPAATVRAAMGDRPEYLDGIIRFMAGQREKAVRGEMTARDVAKAYVATVASQGSGAMSVERFQQKMEAAGISVPLDERFTGESASGKPIIRPEDAMAAWMGSETGQRALDSIERGEFDTAAWSEAAKVRTAFGDDWLGKTNVLGTPARGSVNLSNLGEVVDAVNAAGGDLAKINAAVGKLNGIGAGKLGFAKHLLGFGDSPTVDARQVNLWLAGKSNLRGDKSAGAEAARLFRRSRQDESVRQYMADRISGEIDRLRQELPEMANVSPSDAGAVLHQWMWDKAGGRGAELHDHAGLYEAVSLFQSAKKRLPKVGDSMKDKSGRTFTILTMDPAAGTAKVEIKDSTGKVVGIMPAAPLDKFVEEQQRLRGEQLREIAAEVVNAPRTVQSSLDFSAPLRQGAILTFAEPRLAVDAARDMFAAVKESNYDAQMDAIKQRPNAPLYEDAGLYLAGQQDTLNGREEAFISRMLGKIPVLGAAIKGSERAYTAYLDRLRADSFDKFAEALRASGLDPAKAEDAQEFKDIARFVNMATGRGELPKTLDDAAPLLGGILYSPRYLASRVQFLSNSMTGYAKMAPAARKQAVQATVKYALWVAAIAGLAKAGGAEVETDPESSDFLKLRWGNWRYDLGAGNIQVLRLAFRVAGGLYRNVSGEGNPRGKNPSDVAAQFGRSKLAPSASYVVDAATGKTFNGEKFDAIKGIGERVIPLFTKDLWDAWQAEGAEGALKLTPGLFGVGVQNYESGGSSRGGSGGGSGLFKSPSMPKMPEMPKMPSMK